MNSNKYAAAGWLAVVQAVIFPAAMVIGMIQGIIGASAFGYTGPIFGPADVLAIIGTGISIYTLIKFREILNEQYNFTDINVLITIAIWWGVLFQLGSIAERGVILTIWPISPVMTAIVNGVYLAFFAIVAGIVDILIGVKLFQIKDELPDTIKLYAILVLISGILELTVILTPLVVLIMIPATSIVLALIFFRAPRKVEFV